MDSFLILIFNLISALSLISFAILAVWSVYVYYFKFKNKIFSSGLNITTAGLLSKQVLNLPQIAVSSLPLPSKYYNLLTTNQLVINSKYLHVTNAFPLFYNSFTLSNTKFLSTHSKYVFWLLGLLFWLNLASLLSSVYLLAFLITIAMHALLAYLVYNLNLLRTALAINLYNIANNKMVFEQAFQKFWQHYMAGVYLFPLLPFKLLKEFLGL